VKPVLDGAAVLWVADVPANNADEQQTLADLGIRYQYRAYRGEVPIQKP
jgi:hypothetical protein